MGRMSSLEVAGVPVGEPQRGGSFHRTRIGRLVERVPPVGRRRLLRAAVNLPEPRCDDERSLDPTGRQAPDPLKKTCRAAGIRTGQERPILMRIAAGPISATRASQVQISQMHRSHDSDQHNSADPNLTASKAIASRGTASDAKAMGMATVAAAATAMVAEIGTVVDGMAEAGTEEGTAVATTSGF